MKLIVCVIIIFINLITKSVSQTNNVCPTFQDYYTIKNNSNCWYDFAADLNLTETIKRNGYPVEIHKVTTPDGFILSVFRIPNNRFRNTTKRGPVFLQHGMFGTGALFFGLGKNSIGYLLSDAGYDVWIGNYRGTQYGEDHVNLTAYDKKYWEHSMDEIGLYDIPAQLQLISKQTGQKGNIIYIGHSLGTTVAMIYSATNPNEAKSFIKQFVFLAPVATVPNVITPFKYLSPFADQLLYLMEKNDLVRILSHWVPQRMLYRLFCLESPRLMQNCLFLLNTFYGLQSQQSPENVPVYFNQLPGGTSVRVLRHVTDLELNKFTKYDYGTIENLKRYGSMTPPAYNLSKMSIPIYIMYAVNDWLCTKQDSLNFYNRLPRHLRAGIHEIKVKNFNHNDFLYGKNAKSLVYDILLDKLIKDN